MKCTVLATIITALLSISGLCLDPAGADACVVVASGKAEVIAGDLEGKAQRLVAGLDLNKEYILLVWRDNKTMKTREFPIKDSKVSYRAEVFGQQDLFYSIDLDDFLEYIAGKKKWSWSPAYYQNKNTKNALKLVPRN